MEKLAAILHAGGYSCVIGNGDEIRTFTQRGIADLFDLYTTEPAFLKGAQVADKVIGKAAASLMVLGGVERVYAGVVSEPAMALFRRADIPVEAGETVPFIENRSKTGWCPLESACYEISSEKEAFPVIRDFIVRMRQPMHADEK